MENICDVEVSCGEWTVSAKGFDNQQEAMQIAEEFAVMIDQNGIDFVNNILNDTSEINRSEQRKDL